MIRVLIQTPLDLEYRAVSRHLTDKRSEVIQDAAYEMGRFKGKYHDYEVIIREPGMKNVDMALATERAIQHLHPQIALLTGIAGGVKDVDFGDVLIATKAYGYESGKEDKDGYKSRPTLASFSSYLLAHAQLLGRNEDWKNRTSDGAYGAKLHYGAVAAGDKVIASTDNQSFQRLKLHFNDTLAVEMEAIGFATAVQPYRGLHALAIRGISDLCEGKAETDRQNWQPIAAERAAAVAFELLWGLKADGFLHENEKMATGSKPDTALPSKAFVEIRTFISKGRLPEALKTLGEFAAQGNTDYQDEIILLNGKYENLSRKERLGTVSNTDANLERNQITASLLAILSDMEGSR